MAAAAAAGLMPPGLSCPRCGARVATRADVCGECGYRVLEAAGRQVRRPRASPARRRRLAIAAVAAVLASIGVALLAGSDEETGGGEEIGGEVAQAARARSELLARRALSASAAERRLEERFTERRDGDGASVHCSERIPRPAHSIRFCQIRYRAGSLRRVVVLLDPRGRELLIPLGRPPLRAEAAAQE